MTLTMNSNLMKYLCTDVLIRDIIKLEHHLENKQNHTQNAFSKEHASNRITHRGVRAGLYLEN